MKGKVFALACFLVLTANLLVLSTCESPVEPEEKLVPDISLATQSHNFGEVQVGNFLDWTLSMSNIGDTTLTISNISSNNPVFTIPSPKFPQDISSGDSLNVTVRFSPTEEKSYSGILTITSNDPDESELSVSVEGIAIKWVEVTWSYTFGGKYDDGAYSVQQTIDGGYILAGYTYCHSYDDDYDAWLIKTDAQGNKLWDQTFWLSNWNEAYSVQQTIDGGYILAGWTIVGGGDVLLIKRNAQGQGGWLQYFGGFGPNDGAYSVQQTNDGGYIVAGYTWSYGAGGYDAWLIKTDANGNKLWDKTFGGWNSDLARSVQQTTDGGYILAGCISSYGAGLSDVWLIKTDSEGQKLWDQTFGGSGWDGAYSVQQTLDGGYILAGWTESYGAGRYDVWLIKTDAGGQKLWDKTFGGSDYDKAYSVQQTSDGGYIVAGSTESYGADWEDVWLIKTNSEGQKEWDQTFGGWGRDGARSVQQTTDGGYILAGYTMSYGAGGYDAWLIKVLPK